MPCAATVICVLVTSYPSRVPWIAGPKTNFVPRVPSNALLWKIPISNYTIDEPLCIGCGKCVKACAPLATARCICRSAITAVSTVTSAPLPRPVRRMPLSVYPPANPIYSKTRARPNHEAIVIVYTAVDSDLGLGCLGCRAFPTPGLRDGLQLPRDHPTSARCLLDGDAGRAVLVLALELATYFIYRKRSRGWVFALTIGCLAYFGFYRQGCICAIGAIQNVALTIFDHDYALPLTALLFFVLPLVFSLFFGRVFCSGVCPLGRFRISLYSSHSCTQVVGVLPACAGLSLPGTCRALCCLGRRFPDLSLRSLCSLL